MLFPVDAAELQALSRQLQQRTHVLQKTHQRQSTERTHTHTKLAVWALVAAVVASWLTPLLRELLTRTRWSDVLVVYLVVELAFFIYQRRRYWVANQVVHDLPEMPGGLTLTITDYLLSQDIPLQEFVEGWFHGAALDDIKRGNMLEFLAYGIFYSKFVALQDDEQQHLRDLLAYVECKLGYTFAQGYNTRLQFMAHLWQVGGGWCCAKCCETIVISKRTCTHMYSCTQVYTHAHKYIPMHSPCVLCTSPSVCMLLPNASALLQMLPSYAWALHQPPPPTAFAT